MKFIHKGNAGHALRRSGAYAMIHISQCVEIYLHSQFLTAKYEGVKDLRWREM